MKRTRVLASLFVVLLLPGVLVACGTAGGGGGGGTESAPVPTIIDEDTTVIGGDGDATSFERVGDTLVFDDPAAAADIEVGDVLVSAEGEGLLRQATAIRTVDGRVEVDTADAVLTQAIESGSVETTLNLGQAPDGQSLGMQNAVLRPQAFEPIAYDFAQELFNGTVDHPELGSASLLIEISEGAFVFTPDIDLDFVIQESALESFSLVASGELSLDAELHVNASGAVAESGSVMVVPAGKDYLYRHVFTQWIGWVPVVEVVTVDLELGYVAEASTELDVTTSAGATASLNIGAKYDSGDWTAITTEDGFETRFEAPAATARIEGFGYVYAKPILSVELYGVAGPEIWLEGGPRLDIDSDADPWWTLKALLKSQGRFNAKILDYGVSSSPFTLIDEAWLLASSDGVTGPSPVSVSISPSASTLAPGERQIFRADVANATDLGVSWAATCGSLEPMGDSVVYTAPGSQGLCEVTATSVEDRSATATAVIAVRDDDVPPLTGSVSNGPLPTSMNVSFVDIGDGSEDFVGVLAVDGSFDLAPLGSPPTPSAPVTEAFLEENVTYGGDEYVSAYTHLAVSDGGAVVFGALENVDFDLCENIFGQTVICSDGYDPQGYIEYFWYFTGPVGLLLDGNEYAVPEGWSVLRIDVDGSEASGSIVNSASGEAEYVTPAELEGASAALDTQSGQSPLGLLLPGSWRR